MNAARIVMRIGSAMLVTGVFLVAFVAYQLWGTAVVEHGAQSALVQQLRVAVGSDVIARPSPSPAPTTSTSTTGAPEPKRKPTITPSTSTVPTLPPESANVSPQQSVPTTPVFTGYVAPSESAPAPGSAVGYLSIPKIGVDDAIVEGVGESQLQSGPGHYPGTPMPGEAGNAAIAGHRTTYGAPFYDLNELQKGDPIYVQTSQGVFQYAVTDSFAVAPSNVSVLDATTSPTLTLTTCNPRYSASQRLIVTAAMVSSQPPAGQVPSSTVPATPAPKRFNGSVLPGADQGLAGSGQGVTTAVLWGVLTVIFAIGTILLARFRRMNLMVRLAAGLVGAPLTFGTMFLFFEHVSSVLPGSF